MKKEKMKSDQKQREDRKVDEVIKQTFPASDAPAWYAGKDKVRKGK